MSLKSGAKKMARAKNISRASKLSLKGSRLVGAALVAAGVRSVFKGNERPENNKQKLQTALTDTLAIGSGVGAYSAFVLGYDKALLGKIAKKAMLKK